MSGEELLRGYHAAYPGQRLDGVIGLDLQSLADLFRITGPVDLPHFGTVTGDNLVQTLAGSYGDFASVEVRHQLNQELVPAFRQKFFEGGQMADKLKALVNSADGRHFFTYFRNRHVQHQFARVGLSGDLARTKNDYLGVFTQNVNGSKVDYWQHRALTSAVDLHADGSAAVHLGVDVTNAAPPYTLSTPDPTFGYDTRYLQTFIGVFLPRFATLGHVTADGAPYSPVVHRPKVPTVLNRKYFQYETTLPQGATAKLGADYTVPFAADVTSKTTMTYRLDVDPQDLVNPATLDVSVRFPAGWSSTLASRRLAPNRTRRPLAGHGGDDPALRDPVAEVVLTRSATWPKMGRRPPGVSGSSGRRGLARHGVLAGPCAEVEVPAPAVDARRCRRGTRHRNRRGRREAVTRVGDNWVRTSPYALTARLRLTCRNSL